MALRKNFKKKLYLYCISFTLVVGCLSFNSSDKKERPPKEKILVRLVTHFLENAHYNPVKIDDAFSKKVYHDFIKSVDYAKKYFTQEDMAEFKIHKTLIDQEIKEGVLSFYNLVINRFKMRLSSSSKYYSDILKEPFKFEKNDSINTDFENKAFVKDTLALKSYWRKYLKLSVLEKLVNLQQIEKSKQKADKKYKAKSFAVLEKQAREKTLGNLIDTQKRLEKLRDSDWFSGYINIIAATFDPHTSYFSPSIKDRFDVNISGKIEGIGAVLQSSNDYIKIVRVVQGGPAWKQGDLEPGDLIIKVAQGNGKGIDGQKGVDIAGMHIDDAIKIIKGKKGTKVTLTVKKLDNSFKEITITRDVVELENTYLKYAITHKNGKKYALIHLPKFYIDFKNNNNRNAASDMKKALSELNEQNVQGIVIDLRGNGGGSLRTAIEIGGFFIKKGPIVQIKNRNRKPSIEKDKDPEIQWKKPVVVLVDVLSASASEILAAALQDYKRAIIIGSQQTFGKGTVQNILDLNKFYDYPERLGALKLTIQKFYRINGGSTQLKGVTPDIIFPTKFKYMPIGEQEEEYALPWDKISSASYKVVNSYSNTEQVIKASQQRIQSNPYFKSVERYALLLSKERNNHTYPLNLKKYEQQEEITNNAFKAFKDIKHANGLQFEYAPVQKSDTLFVQKNKRWHRILSQDLVIGEAIEVLSRLK